MRRQICLLGLLALVGCVPSQPSSTSGTSAPPTAAASSEAAGKMYTLSVPNMT